MKITLYKPKNKVYSKDILKHRGDNNMGEIKDGLRFENTYYISERDEYRGHFLRGYDTAYITMETLQDAKSVLKYKQLEKENAVYDIWVFSKLVIDGFYGPSFWVCLNLDEPKDSEISVSGFVPILKPFKKEV